MDQQSLSINFNCLTSIMKQKKLVYSLHHWYPAADSSEKLFSQNNLIHFTFRLQLAYGKKSTSPHRFPVCCAGQNEGNLFAPKLILSVSTVCRALGALFIISQVTKCPSLYQQYWLFQQLSLSVGHVKPRSCLCICLLLSPARVLHFLRQKTAT